MPSLMVTSCRKISTRAQFFAVIASSCRQVNLSHPGLYFHQCVNLSTGKPYMESDARICDG